MRAAQDNGSSVSADAELSPLLSHWRPSDSQHLVYAIERSVKPPGVRVGVFAPLSPVFIPASGVM